MMGASVTGDVKFDHLLKVGTKQFQNDYINIATNSKSTKERSTFLCSSFCPQTVSQIRVYSLSSVFKCQLFSLWLYQEFDIQLAPFVSLYITFSYLIFFFDLYFEYAIWFIIKSIKINPPFPFPILFTPFPPTLIRNHLNLFLPYLSVFLFTKTSKYIHILFSLLSYPQGGGMLIFCCKWVESDHKAQWILV